MTSSVPIVYEQPVNEHVRVCLRLEHLFNQALHWLKGSNSWDSRAALAAILEILNVVDRPDLKAKFVKEMGRYVTVLARFADMPHIDVKRLAVIQDELQHSLHQFHTMQGRIAQNLRDNDFLNTIRQYLLNPGGGCSFEVPAHHYWLQRPAAERTAQLVHWFSNLRVVEQAVNLSLRLIRQSSAAEHRVAHGGFYQASLAAQSACQLIRVATSHNANVYPEVSVGRHGISIRFYHLQLADRPMQSNDDIHFQLVNCIF
jgi:cell division protein ZapD